MSRLDQAMREAYASADRSVRIIETVEINHPSFAEPARVAMGADVEDDVDLPLVVGGDPVTFTACAFRAIPPGFGDDGPTEWQLSVDNVSGLLSEHLDLTLGDNSPIDVIYRAYRSNDLSAPGEVIEGYRLRDATVLPTTVSGTLYLEDVSQQAFPRMTYTLSEFPGIWAR